MMDAPKEMQAEKKTDFPVSVIIPIYNGAQYIQKAVASALIQPEVVEIILIDDGSKDNSWAICQELVKSEPIISCLHHPNHENRGLGATRNLGIKAAKASFIALLDVDDFFYPNRFELTKRVFAEYPDADAVYEMIENIFESETLQKNWLAEGRGMTMGISKRVRYEDLFDVMVENRYGDIGIDGFTIKKSAFHSFGYYPTLTKTIAEDNHFLLRAAALGKLYPGSFKPVAGRLVHGSNASMEELGSKLRKQLLNFIDVLRWFQQNNIEIERGQSLMMRVLIHTTLVVYGYSSRKSPNELLKRFRTYKHEFPMYFGVKQKVFSYVLLLGLFPLLKKIVSFKERLSRRNYSKIGDDYENQSSRRDKR